MSVITLAVSPDECYYKKHFFSLKFVTKAETEMSCEICQLNNCQNGGGAGRFYPAK
jgi:hypothetical protein